jgi:hypothetical protein
VEIFIRVSMNGRAIFGCECGRRAPDPNIESILNLVWNVRVFTEKIEVA